MGMVDRQGKPARCDPPRFRVAGNGNVFSRGRRMAEQATQQPSDSYVQSFARGLSVIRAERPDH
ncbi:IclR family transcriptional regulator, partial [Achromobacter xylosoxidans]